MPPMIIGQGSARSGDLHSTPDSGMLRVALVTETWPPEVNGVAATFSRVVLGMRQRGHHVQLVRPRQHGSQLPLSGERYAEILTHGVPIPRTPDVRMGLPAGRLLTTLWTRHRPDVVHIATEGALGWSALRTARRLGLPVLSDFRTNFHAYSRHYGIGFLRTPVMAYLRQFHNATACTMVPTEALRSELAATGFRGLRVVARGVDAKGFDPAHRNHALRAAWGAARTTPVALCVGRLAPEKNLGLVVDAVEAMRKEAPGLRLVFVGDGPERVRLQARCPDAIFAGQRRGGDLAAHYASADVFLFPSMTETFGNVVPEAMASGLAVLAYNHAAAGQLIRHGENGLLAPLGDHALFCSLARRLVGDTERLQSLGPKARETASALDWDHVIDAIESEYQSAMAGAARQAGAALAPA